MEIPIANIYYLLCYAWDVLQEKDTLSDVDVDASTDLLDLFAKVLANGAQRLRRRGLDRGYLTQQDEIPGARGKLLVTHTLRRNLLHYGRTACVWDELEYDTLPNRILKTTLMSLHSAKEIDPRTRTKVYDLLRWLATIQPIEIRAEHFRRVQLHRNNRIYAFLLHVCEFIYEHSLPTEGGTRKRFREFVRDQLWRLFQEFVFNFFSHHRPPGWNVSRFHIYWQMVNPNEDAKSLVPRMETDVCLKGPSRAIILDTKFYANALKTSDHGTQRLDPSNLYQLFTYLRQQSNTPGWEHAEGVLLFPQTSREFSADFITHGHRIRALSIDLAAQPWQKIHTALLNILEK